MDVLGKVVSFEATMGRIELSHLLAMLVNEGAVRKEAAMSMLVTLSEQARGLNVDQSIRTHADKRAATYEDLANMLAGRGLLPRDAKR